MSDAWKGRLLVGGVIVLCVSALTWAAALDASRHVASTGVEVSRTERSQYEEGATAFRVGVPAEANPYKGSGGMFGVTENAQRWLRGWIDAKKQAEGAK